MNFNKHSAYEGQHAFLGASKYHWINYDENRIRDAYLNHSAKVRGTILHDFASQCIRLMQRLPDIPETLNMYVNDSIERRLSPEQVIYYSDNCFGTADAIGFNNDILYVHDLKTGVVPAHIEQLEIYAALFCLEYSVKPTDIFIELRIYQNNDIIVSEPDPDRILYICDKIVTFDRIINSIRKKEE